MPRAQPLTRFSLAEKLGLYTVRTVEGLPLIMKRECGESVTLDQVKYPTFFLRLYRETIQSAQEQGLQITFGLPLAQDHAELIRNAHANLGVIGSHGALNSYVLTSTFKPTESQGPPGQNWMVRFQQAYLADNGIFYVVNKEGFNGVIIADRLELSQPIPHQPANYRIEDILKAEMTEMFKSKQGRVLALKDFDGVRIVEDYNFKIGHQSTADFEKNPLVVAIVNGQERAEAVARFAGDKKYFHNNVPYVSALDDYSVARAGGLVRFMASLGNEYHLDSHGLVDNQYFCIFYPFTQMIFMTKLINIRFIHCVSYTKSRP